MAEICRAFAAADVVIAEIGGWSNCLDPRPEQGRQAIELTSEALAVHLDPVNFVTDARTYWSTTAMLGVGIWAYMQLAFLGLVLLLASRVIGDMTGVQDWAVILVIGLASVVYTSAGGMQSVVWTDVFQFIVLFFGAVVVLIVIATQTGSGPTDWWSELVGRTHEFSPLFSYDLTTRPVGMMLANYGAGALFTLLQIGVGAALLTYYVQMPKALPPGIDAVTSENFADQAFPYFIIHHLSVKGAKPK